MKVSQRDKAIIQLCIKQKKFIRTASILQNEHGIDLGRVEMDIIEEILDLLDVPKDKGWETDYNDPNSFCRDWLIDKLIELPNNKIRTYPGWVKKELLSISEGKNES